MSKSAGHSLGFVLSAVIFGCGLYGTIYLCNTIEATAEPIATWFALGGCVIAAAHAYINTAGGETHVLPCYFEIEVTNA